MRYSIDMDGLALNFVHKRLLGAAKGFVTSFGDPRAAIRGFAEGGREAAIPISVPVRRTAPRTLTARPDQFSAAGKEIGREAKFGMGATAGRPIASFAPGGRPCQPGFIFRNGRCERTGLIGTAERFFPGGATGIAPPRGFGAQEPVGDAVMGRYGAALVPGSRIIDRAVCLRGMQLGDDGLCYNRGQIRNTQRMWPAGRKPLLTGGDMRAITVAATAGRRLERASKRLQKIGLMKKPPPRRKQIVSGPTEHHHH